MLRFRDFKCNQGNSVSIIGALRFIRYTITLFRTLIVIELQDIFFIIPTKL